MTDGVGSILGGAWTVRGPNRQPDRVPTGSNKRLHPLLDHEASLSIQQFGPRYSLQLIPKDAV